MLKLSATYTNIHIYWRLNNMCLCKGTGVVHVINHYGIDFHPCPDSNCTFDKNKADLEYEMWVKRGIEYYKQNEHSNVALP